MVDPSKFPLTVTTGKTLVNRTGTWRANRPVYVQYTPPCREACPAGEDIARWIDLLRGQDYQQAWQILTEDNPFPATMGRICVHPCQSNCNRGHHDEAIGINSLEQFLGDRALAESWAFNPPQAERAQKVAIVGGGPAGLTCAYQLRRMGYQVTIFEAGDRLGGALASALPEYHLPATVINGEIDRIIALGIQVHLGQRIGQSISWDQLAQDYQAIFMAVGAPVIPGPNLPGLELSGVVGGLDLLGAVKSSQVDRLGLPTAVGPGQQVVVLGAGLTGIEAARTCLRLGAQVTIVTAEAHEDLMLPDRVQEATQEGVTMICGNMVQSLLGRDGAVVGVQLSDQLLPADAVILATGREVDLESFPEDAGVDSNFHIDANPFTGETNMTGLFAGGDVTGTRYAVEAIGAGKKAAAAMHAYLQELDIEKSLSGSRLGYGPGLSMRYYLRPDSFPDQVQVKLQRVVTYEEIEALYFKRQARTHRTWLPAQTRVESFVEARSGLSEVQALHESKRCFNCGTCIGCDNCLIFCPDMAITKTADGSAFDVNLDYCKGCGACVQECPREALILEVEIK